MRKVISNSMMMNVKHWQRSISNRQLMTIVDTMKRSTIKVVLVTAVALSTTRLTIIIALQMGATLVGYL